MSELKRVPMDDRVVMRLSPFGVEVNPKYSVDEAAKLVLETMHGEIRQSVHAMLTNLHADAVKCKTDLRVVPMNPPQSAAAVAIIMMIEKLIDEVK